MKQRRLELGLTQEELCEGICEPITISRMENGRQTPSRNRINALLQRLGLPDDRYFALLSKREEEIAALQKEIIACSVQRDTAHGWELLGQLEQITEPDDHVTPLPGHPGEGRRTVQCGRAAANADEGPADDGASF